MQAISPVYQISDCQLWPLDRLYWSDSRDTTSVPAGTANGFRAGASDRWNPPHALEWGPALVEERTSGGNLA